MVCWSYEIYENMEYCIGHGIRIENMRPGTRPSYTIIKQKSCAFIHFTTQSEEKISDCTKGVIELLEKVRQKTNVFEAVDLPQES